MEKVQVKVGISILNFNSCFYTFNCVKSILDTISNKFSYHIVIVDNGSEEKDFLSLNSLQHFPNITIIRSEENLGFSRGHELGLKYIKADYYYLLNNDCILMNDCVTIFHDFCEKNKKVGICTGQMYNEYKQRTRSFNYLPTLKLKLLGGDLLRFFNPSGYPSRNKIYSTSLKVPSISGSSMFIRAKALEKAGGINTDYFIFCEEEDLCLTMRRNNYDVFFIPFAKYQHFSGRSISFRRVEVEKEFYISLFLFYRKHYSYFYRKLIQIFLSAKFMFKIFKSSYYWDLFKFIVNGAQKKYSLRFNYTHNPQIYVLNPAVEKEFEPQMAKVTTIV